jgi:hypothetical protein
MRQVPDVGWDPISVHHQLPLHSKLFVLYLIVLATLSVVRLGVLVRDLRSLGAAVRGNPEPQQEAEFRSISDACWARLQAMKRSVVLTFLLAVLVAADQARTDFVSVAVQKATGIASLSGGFAELFATFTLGVLACVAIYATYALCEGSLIRRTHNMRAFRRDVFAKRPEPTGT